MLKERKNQILKWAGALCLLPLFVGCAADQASIGLSDMEERAFDENSDGDRDCIQGVAGGCFHGSMTCDSLTIHKNDDRRVAICFDNAYRHEISGSATRAICIESENLNGDACQICQTQAGDTVYDDCALAPEQRVAKSNSLKITFYWIAKSVRMILVTKFQKPACLQEALVKMSSLIMVPTNVKAAKRQMRSLSFLNVA